MLIKMDANPEPPPRHKRGRKASMLATPADEAHSISLESASDDPQSLTAVITSSPSSSTTGIPNPPQMQPQDIQISMQVPPRQRRLSRRTSNPIDRRPVDQNDLQKEYYAATAAVISTARGDNAGYPFKDTPHSMMRIASSGHHTAKNNLAAHSQAINNGSSRRQVTFVDDELATQEGRADENGRPSRTARSTNKRAGAGVRGKLTYVWTLRESKFARAY